MRFERACDAFVTLGIGALALLTPLAFGSVETWAIFAMELAIFAITCVWLAGRIVGRRSIKSTGLEVPLLLFLLIVLFQTLPVPPAVLGVVSPRALTLYDRTVPDRTMPFEEWLLASDASRSEIADTRGRNVGSVPVSYSVADTRDKTILFIAYGLIFLIVADRARNRSIFRRLIIWIIFVGVGVAILGIFQKLTWNGKILWFRNPGPATRPFGPFVNSNHFAGYMELIVPLALAVLLTLVSRRAQFAYRLESMPSGDDHEGEGGVLGRLGLRRPNPDARLPWIATSPAPKAVLLGFLFVLSLASIVLSLSRGGFMATILTLALFSPVLVRAASGSRFSPGVMIGGVVILALVLGVAFWVGASTIAERVMTLADLRSEPSYLERMKAWEGSLALFRDHPVLGSGLGTFRTAFSGYYPPGTYSYWQEAHNDYLQLLTEVGIIGMIPVLYALFVFSTKHFLPAMLDRHRPDRYMIVGLAMALVSMILHSLVDFSLQIPAVGLLFVMIGGLLAGGSRGDSAAPESIAASRSNRFLMPACLLVVLGLTITTAYFGVRRVAADRLLATVRRTEAPATVLAARERAMALAPWRPEPQKSFGDRAVEIFDAEMRDVPSRSAEGRKLLDRAEEAYRRLVSMRPLSAYGWWGLGQVYARRSGIDRLDSPFPLERLVAEREEDLPRSTRLGLGALRTALLLEPNSDQVTEEMAMVYRDEGLREAAIRVYRETARIMPFYNRHQFGPAEDLPDDFYRAIVHGMEAALLDSEIAEADVIQKELGEMAYLRRDLEEAERRYRLGLGVARTKLMADSLSAQLGEVLRQRGKAIEAAALLERAAKNPLMGEGPWISLGDLKASAGDHAAAVSAYRSAASLAPRNVWPRIRLAQEMARAGDRPAAIVELRQVVDGGPAPPVESRELLVKLLREEGKAKEALVEAQALASIAPYREDYRGLVNELDREAGGGGKVK